MNEPLQIRAGDSASWTETDDTYPPSDGWTLKYFLSNQTNTLTLTATDDGSSYSINITPSGSSTWVPGKYSWARFVTKGSGESEERHTLANGSVEILPNLSAAVAYDTRSDARVIYDGLIAAYKDFISSNGTMQSFSIGSKSVTFKSSKEILDQIKYWASIVRTEEDAANVANGGTSRRRVGTRFQRL